MSKAQSEETKLRAEEIEKLIEAETADVENLMKAPTELKGIDMTMRYPSKAIERGIDLIKKAGLLLLKFNSLAEGFKINLFGKLMKYVEKLKDLLDKFGKRMGVESFSIEVSLTGVSLSFTFIPK